MKLLYGTIPMIFEPTLAGKLGLNEAIILQQLYYLISHSTIKRDGYTWYIHTYEMWQRRFHFWSKTTIKRTFQKLEKEQYIISTDQYNRLSNDRKKWYRLNYEKLAEVDGLQLMVDATEHTSGFKMNPPMESKRTQKWDQNESIDRSKTSRSYKRELNKENNRENRESSQAIEIINYLNEKAHKRYNVYSMNFQLLIYKRLQEGYKLEDFYKVIDDKVSEWFHDTKMNRYLRPNTLFSEKYFEIYLNEALAKSVESMDSMKPVELDFNAGEKDDWYVL